MPDAHPLPPRPHLDHYKKRAKALVRNCKADSGAAVRFQARWRTVNGRRPHSSLHAGRGAAVIAREHGFESWPKFARHIDGLTRARSTVSRFEAAVEAIVAGDADALARLLRERPSLVRARSTRGHRSTLLHYVSANGVEDFRQKTPQNIVRMARLLLDAGADVNAESAAYGGHSTTLGLTATSVHPAIAGVQNELLQLLLDRGATVDGGDVVSSLRNGRGPAADYLAERGVRLDSSKRRPASAGSTSSKASSTPTATSGRRRHRR